VPVPAYGPTPPQNELAIDFWKSNHGNRREPVGDDDEDVTDVGDVQSPRIVPPNVVREWPFRAVTATHSINTFS
jgi:hypothetical protein